MRFFIIKRGKKKVRKNFWSLLNKLLNFYQSLNCRQLLIVFNILISEKKNLSTLKVLFAFRQLGFCFHQLLIQIFVFFFCAERYSCVCVCVFSSFYLAVQSKTSSASESVIMLLISSTTSSSLSLPQHISPFCFCFQLNICFFSVFLKICYYTLDKCIVVVVGGTAKRKFY